METVDFPELGLYGLKAKIDTGAYTSSIHVESVKQHSAEGRDNISFVLLDAKGATFHKKKFTLPLFTEKLIKNSFGQSEKRSVIKTKILLFEHVFDIELSLADRSKMEYPVLLGRKLLKKGFVVDVTKANCSIKAQKQKK
jgi:hypothetical protein